MADIINNILKELPQAAIADATFEGANIVLYTSDRNFFLEADIKVKAIVDKIKKRVELRAAAEILQEKERE